MNLEILLKFRCLGNSALTRTILSTVYSSKNGIQINDIKIICKRRELVFLDVIEANILLLEQLGLISKKGNRIVKGKIKIENNDIEVKIIELLLNSIVESEKLFTIFKPEGIFYDNTLQQIGIKPNYLSLEYSQLRDLLLAYKFYTKIDGKYGFYVNKKYENYFKEIINASKIKEIRKIEAREFSLEELERILEIRNEMGKMGEKIAYEFEMKRLVGHSFINRIKIISEFSVGKGYDIVSFNDTDSTEINRYIEVKTYKDNPRFFWSENEVNVSRQLGEQYYLYLVNISQINQESNIILIKDPYKNVFNSKNWKLTTSTWEVNKA